MQKIQQPDIDAFAGHLKELGKSASTIESYTRDARRFHKYLTVNRSSDIDARHLIAYQEYLRSKNEKENSIRRSVIGIRQFFRYLSEASPVHMDSPFDEIPIPTRLDSHPLYLVEENIEDLFQACDQNGSPLKTSRDRAILALLAFEGMKASELIGCDWSYFLTRRDGKGSLHVRGERNRTIELHEETTHYLLDYRKHCEALAPGFRKKMFISFKGRDAALPLPTMSRHGLKFMLSELAHTTKLRKLNSELLRYFAISRLSKAGRTNAEIMAHLGLKRLGNIAKVHNRNGGQAHL